MNDKKRLDWIDEPLMLSKLMNFWLQQRNVISIREAIDSFKEATDRADIEADIDADGPF